MKRRHLFGALAATALVAGLIAFGVTKISTPSFPGGERVVEVAAPQAGTHFTNYEKERYPDLTYAAENAVQAVVNIQKTEEVRIQGHSFSNPFFEFFGFPDAYEQQEGPTRERMSGGSGVIISPDGYIVTNNHVIENAKKLKVKLHDNRTYEGTVVGTDPTTDVALIKIDETNLPTIPFGNSEELRLGEWVLAIGSPYDLQSTVTAGIVSAKARNLSVIPNSFSVESFIQTDAAVNPGNSGGALVNTAGQLVGINTVIKSPTGSFTGYSFAVPTSIVQKVVIDLKEFGIVQRAFIGITYNEINNDFIERYGEEYGIKEIGGVYVQGVNEGGAAEAAGIKKGDIITRINDVEIDRSTTLQEHIAQFRPNDKIKITAKRDGKVKHFDVVLRNKAGKAELLSKDYVDAIESLGGSFADISDKDARELKIDGGVRVTSIKEDGILSKARIRKGYIITHINDKPVRSVSDLLRITAKITSIDGVYPDGRSASYALVSGAE